MQTGSAGDSRQGAEDRWPNLDMAVIESLRELGDEAFNLTDLKATFAEAVSETIDEIQAAVDNDDGPKVRALAHRLKGSGASMGAKRFALTCCDLEIHSTGPLDGGATVTLEQLRAEFDAAVAALAEALPDVSPGGQG